MTTTTTDPLLGYTFDHRTIIQGVAPSYVIAALVIGVFLGALVVLSAVITARRIR